MQETLHFDPGSGRLSTLRSKEEAHDYRYFPEPDLVPVAPTDGDARQAARVALPELPAERAERYAADWELPEDTARLFAFEPDWGDFFEEAATAAAPIEARPVANWVTELRSRLDGADPVSSPASAQAIAGLDPARRGAQDHARQRPQGARPAGRRRAATRPRSSSARASARWRTTASWPGSSPR